MAIIFKYYTTLKKKAFTTNTGIGKEFNASKQKLNRRVLTKMPPKWGI